MLVAFCSVMFCIFANSFNSWLNRSQLDPTFFYNAICGYMSFWLKYIKKIQSHTDNVFGKWGSVLITFTGNYRYSSLILPYYSTIVVS